MSSDPEFDCSYDAKVITDESTDTSTQSYYNEWSVKTVSESKDDDALANAARPITDDNGPVTTCAYYTSWSNKYEKDMVVSNYNGPKYVVESFLELGLDRNLKILDFLAGTGLVAELLRPHGYTNIDAIDGSQEMLAFAQKKKLYQNVQVALLGGEHKAPIADDTYDIVIASGAFAPGHLYSDAFEDIVRITKPGGVITWSMRSDYALRSPKFLTFDDDVEKLVAAGVWKHYVPRKSSDQYLLGASGNIYTMQKI